MEAGRAKFFRTALWTGFIKAVCGAAIALSLGCLRFPYSPAEALLAGALIALSANAINLFDLLDPKRFTLLAFAASPLDEGEIARIVSVLNVTPTLA